MYNLKSLLFALNVSFSGSQCLYCNSLTVGRSEIQPFHTNPFKTKLICWIVRRVKCDEAKPCCYLCTSTGRTCDGYGAKTEPPPDLSGAVLDTSSLSLSTEFLGSHEELQSFYFFRQNTAPQLSGFFGDDFWERLLLQAALHEPSIRHAIVALGSLHARTEQKNGLVRLSHTNGWTDGFPLKNYTQAINGLVKPVTRQGRQAIDVWVLCSILFACLEVSCSDFQALLILIVSRRSKPITAQLLRTSKAA